MKSILCAIGVVVPLTLGSAATAADSKNVNGLDMLQPFAMSCSSGSSSIFPNGYVVKKTCDGRQVAGIGTALAAANTNALNFGQVGAAGGRYCSISTSAIQIFPGGYLANFSCDGLTISGVGTNATDTGINALGFAQVEAGGGRRCSTSTSSIQAFSGGYVSNFSCSGLTISGLGGTATDAAKNALAFTQVEAGGGRRCSTSVSSISILPGGYVANFSCSGLTISGVGTTTTDAGINANDFASLESAGGRRCSSASVRIVPGGYQAQFTCSGLIVTGVGSTVTAAGQDALIKAEAL